MSESAETIPLAPARNRSIEARRAARFAKARREMRIVDLLNRGVSVAEIAAREEVTEKRMRALVSGILARRMPEPPAEFLALQVSRLNEALMVAYSAMSGANLKAVGLVVRIVRELDRYHFPPPSGAPCGTRPRRTSSRPMRRSQPSSVASNPARCMTARVIPKAGIQSRRARSLRRLRPCARGRPRQRA